MIAIHQIDLLDQIHPVIVKNQNSRRSTRSKHRPDDTKDKIIIEVVDSGIGIKKKDKKKLFKLFGCLQNTR